MHFLAEKNLLLFFSHFRCFLIQTRMFSKSLETASECTNILVSLESFVRGWIILLEFLQPLVLLTSKRMEPPFDWLDFVHGIALFEKCAQKKSLWRNPKIFRFVDERSSCRTESPRYVIVKKLKKFIAFFPLQIHIGPHSIECWEYSRFTDVPLGSSVDLCLRKKNPQSNCELKSENGLYPNVCNFYNV